MMATPDDYSAYRRATQPTRFERQPGDYLAAARVAAEGLAAGYGPEQTKALAAIATAEALTRIAAALEWPPPRIMQPIPPAGSVEGLADR